GDANVAILSGRKAHLHESPSSAADSFVDLSTKAAVPDFRAVLGNNLSVEPSRTIAGNLPVEADGRERPYSQPVAALAEVVGLAGGDVALRPPPISAADPLEKAGPPQCFQSADMRTHESFGVLALPLKAVADALQVPARPVDAAVVLRIAGDVAVSR